MSKIVYAAGACFTVDGSGRAVVPLAGLWPSRDGTVFGPSATRAGTCTRNLLLRAGIETAGHLAQVPAAAEPQGVQDRAALSLFAHRAGVVGCVGQYGECLLFGFSIAI